MSRSRWKIPFIPKIFFSNRFVSSYKYSTFKRCAIISAIFVDKKLSIYNGSKKISVIIQNSMIGKKLGEFSITKIIGRNIALKKHLFYKTKYQAKKKKK